MTDLVLEEIRTLLEASGRSATDAAMARWLGISKSQFSKFQGQPTAKQLARLFLKLEAETITRAHQSAIKPIVEFFEIQKDVSPRETKYEVFGTRCEDGSEHLYRGELREQLKAHSGIYVFYDSRGSALYVGQAKRQHLWQEMNAAFNRDRAIQLIRRVRHPSRNQHFATSEEKNRQIVSSQFQLHELAYYFSAYSVPAGLVDDFEAVLIRSFANDLLNVKMETFGKATRSAAK